MATYKQIQEHVKGHHGWTPETCWIAEEKREYGLTTRIAPNRKGDGPVKPCPPDKFSAIIEAYLVSY